MEKQTHKYESFQGRIVSTPQYKKSEGKQAFACFRIETGKSNPPVWLVKCFGTEAEKANRDLTETGQVVVVQGYRDAEAGDSVFIATFLKLALSETRSERIARHYGSVANYLKDSEAFFNDMRARGMVPCMRSDGTRLWRREEDCVRLGTGEWREKIEFVMDVFGGVEISNLLRGMFSDLPRDKTQGVRYREWLDKKVDEACGIVGWQG